MLGEQTESRSEDPNGKEWSERMMQERRQVGCNTSSFISFFVSLIFIVNWNTHTSGYGGVLAGSGKR